MPSAVPMPTSLEGRLPPLGLELKPSRGLPCGTLDAATWAASSAEVADLLLRTAASFQIRALPGLSAGVKTPHGTSALCAHRAPTSHGWPGLGLDAEVEKWRASSQASTNDFASTHDVGSRHDLRAVAFTPGLGDQRAVVADAGVATTLMVRNIPAECTQEFLLELWPNHGTYDFLYLPRNAGGKSNLGYCFVNFVSEAHAAAFKEKWHRAHTACLGFACSAKRCLSVSLAEVQGLEANVKPLQALRRPQWRGRAVGELVSHPVAA